MGLFCFEEYFTLTSWIILLPAPFLYVFASTGFRSSVKLWRVYTAEVKNEHRMFFCSGDEVLFLEIPAIEFLPEFLHRFLLCHCFRDCIVVGKLAIAVLTASMGFTTGV